MLVRPDDSEETKHSRQNYASYNSYVLPNGYSNSCFRLRNKKPGFRNPIKAPFDISLEGHSKFISAVLLQPKICFVSECVEVDMH